MKTVSILFLLLLFTSCSIPKSGLDSVKYPGSLGKESICHYYWDDSVAYAEHKRDACIFDNYLQLRVLNKPIEKVCPIAKFSSEIIPAQKILTCENHLSNPKFKKGNKLKFKSAQYDSNCTATVIRPFYARFVKRNEKDLYYSVKINCNGEDMSSEACKNGHSIHCPEIAESDLTSATP